MIRPARLWVLCALSALGCKQSIPETPPVSASGTGAPARKVSVLPDGSFEPGCVSMRAGQTVEFLNAAPTLPADVTSLKETIDGREASSGELYSPNLQAPAATSWRHEAKRPGLFTFVNASVGIPGRKVVDDYYGTVTFVPLAGGSAFATGTLCVAAQGDDVCTGVCCPGGDTECRGRTECIHEQCKTYPDDECRRAGDCPGVLVCGPTGRCIAQCRTDRDCAITETCDADRCKAAAGP